MRSLLVLFVVLSVFGFPLYLFVQKNQVPPSQESTRVAKTIPQYSRARNWQVVQNEIFCVERFFKCSTTVPLTFETKDSWPEIYSYYRKYMPELGWKTNSEVFTSVPGSIVFTTEKCEASLAPSYSWLNSKTTELYKFQVSCETK